MNTWTAKRIGIATGIIAPLLILTLAIITGAQPDAGEVVFGMILVGVPSGLLAWLVAWAWRVFPAKARYLGIACAILSALLVSFFSPAVSPDTGQPDWVATVFVILLIGPAFGLIVGRLTWSWMISPSRPKYIGAAIFSVASLSIFIVGYPQEPLGLNILGSLILGTTCGLPVWAFLWQRMVDPCSGVGRPMEYASFEERLTAFVIDIVIIAIPAAATATALAWLYFWFFTVIWNRTPGKMLMKIRVVTDEYERVGVVRSVWRVICFNFLAVLGSWWISRDSQHQAWHDKLAGTYVVRIGKYLGEPQQPGDVPGLSAEPAT